MISMVLDVRGNKQALALRSTAYGRSNLDVRHRDGLYQFIGEWSGTAPAMKGIGRERTEVRCKVHPKLQENIFLASFGVLCFKRPWQPMPRRCGVLCQRVAEDAENTINFVSPSALTLLRRGKRGAMKVN